MARNVLYLSVALNYQAALKPWAKPLQSKTEPVPTPCNWLCPPPVVPSGLSLSLLPTWATGPWQTHIGLSRLVHSTQAA